MIDVVPNAGVIALGKQGENQAVRVTLPNIRAGAGSILLLHQRSDDQKPYPVPVVEADGGIIWTVSSTDTAYPGRGQAELQWLGADGAVIKSVTYQTNTLRALTAPGAVPDEPLKPYTQAVARDAQAAKDAAASAAASAQSAAASAGQAGLSADNAAKTLKKLEEGIASGDFRGQDGKSAYQLAVDAGFEGTETQWLESLKGAPGDTTAADAAAEVAKKAAQEAQKAAETAVLYTEQNLTDSQQEQARLNIGAADKARQNVLVGTETGNPISVDDAFSAPLCGLTVYGKSTQDGTPTPDAPVPIVNAGDGGTIAVKMTGKNLLYIPDNKATVRGVTITSKNGIISISGTATEDVYVYLPVKQISIHGLALLSSNASDATVKLVSTSLEVLFTQGSANNTQEVITHICFIAKKGTNYDLNGINVQLELGSTATAYSPYHEQLLTLQTPTGLPGIPVTSGGNYTDQTGQQWVCDEVDLERGVKVQRVTTIVFSDKTKFNLRTTSTSTKFRFSTATDGLKTTNLTTADSSAFCSALALGNKNSTWTTPNIFTIDSDGKLYVRFENINSIDELRQYLKRTPMSLTAILATPIETPLTPAEIAAYKALITYAPDTVVQASDGAGLKLDYQRDVNIVIKKLEDTIASMTEN